jgi:hypothetical protein
MPAPKGHPRYGGRQKGKPNKATADAREAFRMVYERRLDDLDRWLIELAEGIECVHFLSDGTKCKYMERNPGKAAELLIKMAEHFVPKLNRTEHVGEGGSKLEIQVVTLAKREGER